MFERLTYVTSYIIYTMVIEKVILKYPNFVLYLLLKSPNIKYSF